MPSDRIVWVDVEGLPLRAWSKNSFRHILAKWGSIAHLDDNIGEDVYKSRVCILTSFLGIISEVIKVSIDGEIFPIRIKEAPRWNPTFVCEFNKNSDNDSVDEFHRFQQDHEGSNVSLSDKEDVSLDPFGIYDVMKKLDNEEELKKSTKLHKDSSQGHYRNSAQINDESVFQEHVACPGTIYVSQQSLNNLDQEPPFPHNEVRSTADQDGPGAVKIATTAFAAIKNATATFEDVPDSFSTASTPFSHLSIENCMLIIRIQGL